MLRHCQPNRLAASSDGSSQMTSRNAQYAEPAAVDRDHLRARREARSVLERVLFEFGVRTLRMFVRNPQAPFGAVGFDAVVDRDGGENEAVAFQRPSIGTASEAHAQQRRIVECVHGTAWYGRGSKRDIEWRISVVIVEQIWTGNAYRNFNYLIVCPDSGDALAVDPLDHQKCLARAKAKGWNITQILNTHEHGDHTGGNGPMIAATGAKLLAHKNAGPRIDGIDAALRRVT